jgi:hypothetical protein
MCKECKKKWRNNIYISGIVCNCKVEKKEGMIMHVQKGNAILPDDHIDYIKMLFMERAGNQNIPTIYHRKKKNIFNDMTWCDDLYKFILKTIKLYACVIEKRENIFNYKRKLAQMNSTNKLLQIQILQIRDKNELIKERIAEISKKNNEYIKCLNDSERKIKEQNDIINSNMKLIEITQKENEKLHNQIAQENYISIKKLDKKACNKKTKDNLGIVKLFRTLSKKYNNKSIK